MRQEHADALLERQALAKAQRKQDLVAKLDQQIAKACLQLALFCSPTATARMHSRACVWDALGLPADSSVSLTVVM